MSLRFLHCSDFHLGRKPSGSTFSNYSKEKHEDYFRAFDHIVSAAISSKVNPVIITGDIFDKRVIILKNTDGFTTVE